MTSLSKRAQWSAPLNRLTIARNSHRGPLFDLTGTNPTRAGLPYPTDAIAEALARGARASYDPDPRGFHTAREALASTLGCDAGDLILTASTSEAYSYLFKLLTDPGDAIATAIPSYPLLDHLAALELVELQRFPLELHQRWELHEVPVGERTRAIVVVHPNNPTGSFVSADEQEGLARHGLPIVSDEVFLDFPLEGTGRTFVRDDVLTFTLGGLSKSAGLPHLKLAWIRVHGPGRQKAVEALELIADTFLSVSTPVQVALPAILDLAPAIRAAIAARTAGNLRTLGEVFAGIPAASVLPVEGGWSAVLRVPSLMSEEDLTLALLERDVLVQPGYFFDFEREGYLVLSLLTPETVFREGAWRIAEMMPR